MSSVDDQSRNLNRPRHRAVIDWENTGREFTAGRYSRVHRWTFDGGLTIPASPSPHVVPQPWSDSAHVDPEEAFVAAIASCHMLTFLWLASRAGWTVARYRDDAYGILTKNDRRVPWVSEVVLRPEIEWSGDSVPNVAEVESLHHRAHEECFIANSVRTAIRVEPPGIED